MHDKMGGGTMSHVLEKENWVEMKLDTKFTCNLILRYHLFGHLAFLIKQDSNLCSPESVMHVHYLLFHDSNKM